MVRTIVTALIFVASIGSLTFAYFADPSNDIITGSTSLESLTVGEDVKNFSVPEFKAIDSFH